VQRGHLSAEGTADLGRIEGDLLLFGGPYSNLEATAALLEQGRRLGIPANRTFCTGDVAAYGADPEAAAALLRKTGVHVVMGNCEESLAEGSPDCGCGFKPGSACDRLAADWYAYALGHLSADSLRWMGELPPSLRFKWGGFRFAVVHGAPSLINRFVFASAAESELRAEIESAGADVVIGGHCGLPFTRRVGEKLWHNPGAIGLPANDGTARGWYAVLRDEQQDEKRGDGAGPAIEHRALDYDSARAARKMRERGLPEGYATALETGLWPSCDILPPAELAARGRPLALDGQRFALAEESATTRHDPPRRVQHPRR
jgi:predicted phosphodiesterase